MITSLRLKNFRRHADTTLDFRSDAHLILISGQNGAGKSSVFEALLFALYGEGRNGLRNLERLIRRHPDAELEGMEVELEFEHVGATYRVHRRRVDQMTSAVLYCNDVPLTQGPRDVTAEITRILGMDVRGFKLATFAPQRELDGLASMRPAERAKMISRLLRLDLIDRAREKARNDFRENRTRLNALAGTANIDELRLQVEDARKTRDSHNAAVVAALDSLATVETNLAAAANTENRYQQAVAGQALAATAAQAAADEVTRLETDLNGITVPTLIDGPAQTVKELQDALVDVEARIATSSETVRRYREAQQLHLDTAALETRVAALEQRLADTPDQTETATHTLETAVASYEKVRRAAADAAAAVLLAEAEKARTGQALETAESLSAMCESCGQPVTEEHRTVHVASARAAYESAVKNLATKTKKAATLDSKARQLEKAVTDARAAATHATRTAKDRENWEAQRAALTEQVTANQNRIATLPTVEPDLDSLTGERDRLRSLAGQAEQARTIREQHTSAVATRRQLETQLAAAKRRAGTAAKAVQDPSQDLVDAHARYQQLTELRDTETTVVASLRQEAAVAAERVTGLENTLRQAEKLETRKQTAETEAEIALHAAQILENVGSEWAQQIRPSLEGAVSDILSRLSDGRFDTVQLDSDYNVSVRDSGTFRPLTELSGGEIDLVALAMRLGLSTIVLDRHPTAGSPGFLVLDECFGSQDPTRREAILAALRNLRGRLGQIFLISHVGGLEDSTDQIIEIEWDREENVSRVA